MNQQCNAKVKAMQANLFLALHKCFTGLYIFSEWNSPLGKQKGRSMSSLSIYS